MKLVGADKGGTLRQAREQAKLLFTKYDDEQLVIDRIELSDLVLKMEKGGSGDEPERLQSLKSKFAAVYQKENGRINGEIQNIDLIGDIRHIEVDDWTRKWVAVCVILLLLKRFCAAWGNGMPFEEVTEPEIYLGLCPVARNPIILPFSEGSGRSISANMQDVDRKIGFKVRDLLEGKGLDGPDQVLLKHLAHTLGLNSQVISEFPRVEMILKGRG